MFFAGWALFGINYRSSNFQALLFAGQITGIGLKAINSSKKVLKITGPALFRINSVIMSARTVNKKQFGGIVLGLGGGLKAVYVFSWGRGKNINKTPRSQISIEPGFGAYQRLAQKIEVPLFRISSLFLQFWGFEGDFKTRAKPRWAPNSGGNAFRWRVLCPFFPEGLGHKTLLNSTKRIGGRRRGGGGALVIDLLIGLFRGAVFRHGGGARKQPIKQPIEMPTSTMALMGRFQSLMGRFPTLMGRFPDFVLRGRFASWKSTGKQPIKKRGIKRLLIL